MKFRTTRQALRAAALWVFVGTVVGLAGCERPPVDMVQRGYRGTAMDQVYNPRTLATQVAANALPEDSPMAAPGGPPASSVFKNLKVVGDLGVGEFTRLMTSMTAWVAPTQGCAYCHKAGEDFSSDALYTKVVARRMLQMTRHINTDWKQHVSQTGVTCWTCHRGQAVPSQIWFAPAHEHQGEGMLGDRAGQNAPSKIVAWASLPNDPLSAYLLKATDVRVIGENALPVDNRKSIKQAEFTYGFMMHISQSLGVNCTFCHNTRSFAQWDASTPQRATAWYGIRMARDLNVNYLGSLADVFPANRLGPTGDVPKVSCATCHQGAYKPLYGANLLATHPELTGVSASVTTGASGVPGASAVLYFAVGSSALSGPDQQALAPLVAALAAQPQAKVTISGFHSASGSLAQNQQLAKERAVAVRNAFAAAGIAADRVVLEKPQVAEANLSGEDPKARRVELAVR